MNAAAPILMEAVPVEGFVYCVVQHERKAAKIGWSRDPARRLRQLQTASPDSLTLFETMPGDRALEAAFHRDFAPRRMTGEWFDNRDGAVTAAFGQLAWEVRCT